MLPAHGKRLVPVAVTLVALTGASLAGCSDGVPTGRKGGDDFDRDDITVSVVQCASEENPGATAKVTADTSHEDRKYYVAVNFLDADGKVIDSSSQELTPQPDSEGDEEITAKVEFPMSEPKKASQVESCEVDHAF